jgi:arginine utilization regulatory protein
LAKLPNPTLIYGETGTGKELFAQAMITQSGVPRSKVVVLNCATVPENLMESILFGTKRGIYTGAENRRGLFEEADGGILFLDELNAIPYQVQAKLLRVLQDGTFRPLGDNRDKTVNVKIIAAMNVEPEEAMARNILRKDLFYRFSSSIIRIQPLRKRQEDIELFIEYYIKHFQDLHGKHIRGITGPLREALLSYRWEGNVRELKNVIELAVEFAGDDEILGPEHLPSYLHERLFENERGPDNSENADGNEILPLSRAMEALEKDLILRALQRAAGNKTKTAELLGIPRQTLTYKMKQLQLKYEPAKHG